ncbi:uncharacterized protein BKA78DRAFT_365483 [Phyllosticta capitalensis]|uniref:uncharacterized protein n=1 Tax=Phyllosticta capitalensis TaxID=121624 RepID=UPI00312CCEA3
MRNGHSNVKWQRADGHSTSIADFVQSLAPQLLSLSLSDSLQDTHALREGTALHPSFRKHVHKSQDMSTHFQGGYSEADDEAKEGETNNGSGIGQEGSCYISGRL